jgi:hypothetical protein
MRCLAFFSAALVWLGAAGSAAEAAVPCTTAQEWAALRAAAVAQELMVAGLTCQSVDAYNRFVTAYRPELMRSDADLKSYFLRREGRRGEAAYDTFKTKLANLSALSQLANPAGFCAAMRMAFDQASYRNQGLDRFVEGQRLLIALEEQALCRATAPIVEARAEPAPDATASERGPLVIESWSGRTYRTPKAARGRNLSPESGR